MYSFLTPLRDVLDTDVGVIERICFSANTVNDPRLATAHASGIIVVSIVLSIEFRQKAHSTA